MSILVSGALPGGHGDGELGPAGVDTRRGSLVVNEQSLKIKQLNKIS
jgi:hypothetical protein